MSNPNATGQPVKLFQHENRNKFLQALMKGASYSLACKHAGVSFVQYRELMKRAERYLETGVDENNEPIDDNNAYIEMYRKIESAIAYRALKWLEKIDEASNIHWQAAAWKLERCHPEDYAKKEPDLEKKTEESIEILNKLKETVDKCLEKR